MNLFKTNNNWDIKQGDALSILKKIPDSFIQTSITSPPYYNLRNYKHDLQIGQESSPIKYIDRIVDIYKEIKRTLRDDGTCWINIGDKYVNQKDYKKYLDINLKSSDLMGIPWRLAQRLQEDGWYVRQMIPWVKCNALPENVPNRPNNSIEYVILISKKQKYYFDMEGAKECLGVKRNWRNGDSLLFMDVPTERTKHSHTAPMPLELARTILMSSISHKGCCSKCKTPLKRKIKKEKIPGNKKFTGKSKEYYEAKSKNSYTGLNSNVSNKLKHTQVKTIGWEMQCKCKDNSIDKQIVLDPFSGSGTTGIITLQKNQKYLGIELNTEYAEYSKKRLKKEEYSLSQDIFNGINNQIY